MISHQVLVLAPLPEPLDYLSPSTVPAGCRVRVPLGNRQAIGLVLGHDEAQDPTALKPIGEVIDTQPLGDSHWLALIRWAANYYGCRQEAMLRTALPTWGRHGRPAQLPVLAYQWHGDAPRGEQRLRIHAATQQPCPIERLKTINWPIARTLIKAGLLQPVDLPNDDSTAETGPTLMPEQADAIERIDGSSGPWLLEGITGSGKTEVYLQLAHRALARRQQVLVLVPEIGLTPQLVSRFEARFPGQVIHLHSALADGARWSGWSQVAHGKRPILIGTRSALLTPMPRLGLIVVDEEHDPSYKQAEAPRYHARDLAVVMAHRLSIPVVLGTATPSLETIANLERGRFQHATLTRRAGNATPPRTELVDLRSLSLHDGLSDQALQAVSDTLKRGEQALIFLNRRGFAPILLCHQCGWHPECPSCDAKPTVHLEPRRLWCHHCDYQAPWPSRCPTCAQRLDVIGQGTQRLEESLVHAMAPFPVTRIDRDTAGAGGAGKLLEQARDNAPRVLVGTQMLAKGHDLPNLTLVVVVDADQQLFSGDFRAIESLSQTLIQVMGRAGRADKPGRVLIQTHEPDHAAWPHLLAGDYRALATQELAIRQRSGLPPYGHMALWRARDPDPGVALSHLGAIAQAMAGRHPQVKVLGPSPAPMERRASQYHAQLLLLAPDRKTLRSALATPIPPAPRRLWRGLDMDPHDLF